MKLVLEHHSCGIRLKTAAKLVAFLGMILTVLGFGIAVSDSLRTGPEESAVKDTESMQKLEDEISGSQEAGVKGKDSSVDGGELSSTEATRNQNETDSKSGEAKKPTTIVPAGEPEAQLLPQAISHRNRRKRSTKYSKVTIDPQPGDKETKETSKNLPAPAGEPEVQQPGVQTASTNARELLEPAAMMPETSVAIPTTDTTTTTVQSTKESTMSTTDSTTTLASSVPNTDYDGDGDVESDTDTTAEGIDETSMVSGDTETEENTSLTVASEHSPTNQNANFTKPDFVDGDETQSSLDQEQVVLNNSVTETNEKSSIIVNEAVVTEESSGSDVPNITEESEVDAVAEPSGNDYFDGERRNHVLACIGIVVCLFGFGANVSLMFAIKKAVPKMIPIWLVWAGFLYGFQVSILVSSLIDGNIGSFILNLALLALGLYAGLVIISYRKLILDTSYDVKPVQMNLLGDGYKEMAVMGSGSSSEGDSKV